MGQKINILPEKLVSLIAAGEIIERPASVVKELVENSLDANATEIEVNIKGKEFISVFDNGEGMDEKDVPLSVQKHATSKISKEEDLNSISTFGFRGEALHSIALVSKMTIRTRTNQDELGVELYAEGGKIKSIKKIYIEPGTYVIVKDLFYNTPARKKFLSTDQVEFSHVLDVISRYALALTNIGFKLLKDGEVFLNLKPKRSLEETIKAIFGDTKKDKIEIMFQVGNISIEGLIWREKSSIGKWIFVNKRYVRDKTIFSAISKFSFLKNSDYIIFISSPPEMYDVNVNPTKTEIRWRAPAKIREILITAIEEAIRHKFPQSISSHQEYKESKWDTIKQDIAPSQTFTQEQKTSEMKEGDTLKIANEIKAKKSTVKILTIIKGIFAIVEFEGEIYFVDLHAYHEGKHFREMKEKFLSIDKKEVLRFAIPFEASLPKNTILKIIDRKEEFEKIGMNISTNIEESKVKIFSIPYYLSGFELGEFLEEFADGFEMKKVEKFLADICCRTVIRSGDRLDLWDVLQILDEFDINQKCPHGRSAVIKLDIEELEKKFGRC